MQNDGLGDRMKRYEAASTDRRLLDFCPAIVRIDGRAFHTFTKGLHEPFDDGLMRTMDEAAGALVEEFTPVIAYVQSDEVSLLFFQAGIKSELPFCGRTQKLESVLASAMTLAFVRAAPEHLPEPWSEGAMFDARAWSVPNQEEAANYFLWRERDATRNSISVLAQAHYSPKQLHGKSTADMLTMLEREKGIRWDELSAREKRGRFLRRETFEVEPGVIRSRTVSVEMPPFGRILNRVAVLFERATPYMGDPVKTVRLIADLIDLERADPATD